MTTRVVSPDPVGAELADQTSEGLCELIDCLEKEGDTMLLPTVRWYLVQLHRTPVADVTLAFDVADCLGMLADRYELIGRPEVAEVWRWRAQRIRDRALARSIGLEPA